MKKIKRAVHFDFHTMPGVEDFCANFDAEDFAATLAAAHADYVNVFARCNIGFSYYPTKLGTPYPTMKGDLLGDTIRACHKRGIGVTAYLNGGLNHELTRKRTNLLKINKDGTVYSGNLVKDHFFRTPCYHAGFGQYLLDEIAEILAYDPDGIFVDCLIPKSCYCPACIAKMRAKGIDTADDKAVFAFAVDTLLELFEQIRALVPQDKRLYLNSFPYPAIAQHQSHVELECLPTDSQWGYDFFTAQAPYYRKFNPERIYMTGRFVLSWGDLAGYKSRPALENDVYDALMYGYVPSVGDHMHPRDGIDKRLYREVGEIYSYVQSLEPWTEGADPITEVALLRNKVTHENVRKHFTDSDLGAARMLSELKICFDVINEDMDFDGYKLLILPDHIRITEKLAAKLAAYKGSILSTGSSLAASDTWDYITDFTEDTNTDGFFAMDGRVYGQYSCGIKMHSEYGCADYIEPYFNQCFDGCHSYSYIPPHDCTGYCAAAIKGNRSHICFPIFEAYLQHGTIFHKELVVTLLDQLLPAENRLLQPMTLPASARATLMHTAQGELLQVKTTYPELKGRIGIIEEHVTMPAGRKISVIGEYPTVSVLPDMTPVEATILDGRTEITLPEICGYLPLLLEH